jgi:hypothetical protein
MKQRIEDMQLGVDLHAVHVTGRDGPAAQVHVTARHVLVRVDFGDRPDMWCHVSVPISEILRLHGACARAEIVG